MIKKTRGVFDNAHKSSSNFWGHYFRERKKKVKEPYRKEKGLFDYFVKLSCNLSLYLL